MAVCKALSRALSACSWQSQTRASSPWPGCSKRPAAQDRQEHQSPHTSVCMQPDIQLKRHRRSPAAIFQTPGMGLQSGSQAVEMTNILPHAGMRGAP